MYDSAEYMELKRQLRCAIQTQGEVVGHVAASYGTHALKSQRGGGLRPAFGAGGVGSLGD